MALKPDDTWQENFGNSWTMYNERIGSVALVPPPPTINKNLAQKSFEEIKSILERTEYKISNLSNYGEWNTETIEGWQKELAKIAVQLWR